MTGKFLRLLSDYSVGGGGTKYENFQPPSFIDTPARKPGYAGSFTIAGGATMNPSCGVHLEFKTVTSSGQSLF